MASDLNLKAVANREIAASHSPHLHALYVYGKEGTVTRAFFQHFPPDSHRRGSPVSGDEQGGGLAPLEVALRCAVTRGEEGGGVRDVTGAPAATPSRGLHHRRGRGRPILSALLVTRHAGRGSEADRRRHSRHSLLNLREFSQSRASTCHTRRKDEVNNKSTPCWLRTRSLTIVYTRG